MKFWIETGVNGFVMNDVEQPGVKYPIKMEYCGNCSMPVGEYCEYYPDYENCKKWLADNLPDQFGKLTTEEGADGEEKSGRQKRGGRGKKKAVTVVQGLTTFGIDLKVAQKFFSSRFACSSSVQGDDEVIIQGDVKDELFDVLPEKWPVIDEDLIDDIGECKR